MKMTKQLDSKLDARLHERFAEAREQLSDDSTLPVVIRCDREVVNEIVARVNAIGGKVRHQMNLIGAVAAWLPLRAIEKLGSMPEVRSLEMEEQYHIAR
jgi:hypothetical protein